MQPTPDKHPPVQAVSSQESSERGEPTAYPPLVMPALIQQAQDAFFRDLPLLLRERLGQWVAYHGDQQVGFAPTDLQLYQDCLRQGIDERELLVLCIEPDGDPFLIGLR